MQTPRTMAHQTHWKAEPPEPPFYAVIFLSRKGPYREGYAEMDARMMAEAQEQPGYLGYSSAGNDEGGIFISYWQDQESIARWREHAGHRQAKSQAPAWYDYYHSIISRVEQSVEYHRE